MTVVDQVTGAISTRERMFLDDILFEVYQVLEKVMPKQNVPSSPAFANAIDWASTFLWTGRRFLGGTEFTEYSKFATQLKVELIKL